MAALRLDVMWTPLERAILAQQIARRCAPGKTARCGNAITLGGDADNLFVLAHKQAE